MKVIQHQGDSMHDSVMPAPHMTLCFKRALIPATRSLRLSTAPFADEC